MSGEIQFCRTGGCTAKLGPGILDHVLKKIPRSQDDHLLVGYDSADDAAVYRLTDELAIVQTLDFFPLMVEDPYIFGQIAAANALSDIYAMGGEVKSALNIVCFPEQMDLNILGRILQGGAEKVQEAGGVLAGGHSIADADVKYGLSVTGTVHPDKIWKNNGARPGDRLILTKPLGVGIITAASRVKEASKKAVDAAVCSMTALNRYAAQAAHGCRIHGCTDVTGFGLLCHLNEMLGGTYGAKINASALPVLPEAASYAEEFLITAAAQRNRNFVGDKVFFEDGVSFAMEELMFDPQTSGGLLFAVDKEDAQMLSGKLKELGMPAGIIGEVTEPSDQKEGCTVGRIHVFA